MTHSQRIFPFCLACAMAFWRAGPVGAAESGANTSDHRSGTDWWSLQPLNRSEPPAVKDAKWCRNEIDRFILQQLEAADLQPNPEAEKRVLIRRVTFDLTGLPPTPVEVQAFLDDASPGAYECLVDRLLASPHYGEQWARHWLDVVRFGESEGFEHNRPRPAAWRYRDWVIWAFNSDLRYDQFIQDQIAGDVLRPHDPRSFIASGYLTAGSYDSLGLTKGTESMITMTRLDHVEDVVGNLGQTFLGLTVNCARCHDHKFDPIRQKEFYQFAAAIAGVEDGQRDLDNVEDAAVLSERDRLTHQADEVRARMLPLDGAIRQRLGQAALDKARSELKAARAAHGKASAVAREAKAQAAALKEEADAPADQSTKKRAQDAQEQEKRLSEEARKQEEKAAELDRSLATLVAAGPDRQVAYAAVLPELREKDRQAYLPLLTQVTALEMACGLLQPGPVRAGVCRQPGQVHVLLHGDFRRPAEAVTVRGIAAVNTLPADLGLAEDAPESQRRAKLAQWMTDPRNPLPARVMANRLWLYHFGAGLVRTPNDFGFNGGHPSHPRLLDFLARELIDHGWSIKHLQRLMVLSAAYRQSSALGPGALHDAEDRLLWRKAPTRLEAESLRDSMLLVSGELNPQMGGPGYADFEHQFMDDDDFFEPKEVAGPEFDRRSIYRTWNRSGSNPLLETFDCPDPSVATPNRGVTTTPLQALSMLNGALSGRLARAFANRLDREAGRSLERQIELGYRLAYCRPPADEEVASARRFIQRSGMQQFCLVLFNSNEFLYVD